MVLVEFVDRSADGLAFGVLVSGMAAHASLAALSRAIFLATGTRVPRRRKRKQGSHAYGRGFPSER
jgi:hypothetical protein